MSEASAGGVKSGYLGLTKGFEYHVQASQGSHRQQNHSSMNKREKQSDNIGVLLAADSQQKIKGKNINIYIQHMSEEQNSESPGARGSKNETAIGSASGLAQGFQSTAKKYNNLNIEDEDSENTEDV